MNNEHPLPPEGINTTPTHPLKEFALLTTGLIVLVTIVVTLISMLSDYLIDYIPFETEVRIAEAVAPSLDEERGEVQEYLQNLVDQLGRAQALPTEMKITVHYVDAPTVNAMATLGGHLVIFRGLLQKLESENAIAMVIAHEVAHVHHRHPIHALGRGAVISLAMVTMGLASSSGDVLGQTGLLTHLSFSRSQEQQADDTALQSLAEHYGHVEGATDLFAMLTEEHKSDYLPTFTFLSTHPLGDDRIGNIQRYARQKGWENRGTLTAVPKAIRMLIDAAPQE